MTTKKRDTVRSLLAVGLMTVTRVGVAVGLFYKGIVQNDLSHTVAQDPMEIWIALGVGILLLDFRGTRGAS